MGDIDVHYLYDYDADGNFLSWNCRDRDGRRVGSRVYWAEVRINGERNVAKFTVLN